MVNKMGEGKETFFALGLKTGNGGDWENRMSVTINGLSHGHDERGLFPSEGTIDCPAIKGLLSILIYQDSFRRNGNDRVDQVCETQ